MSMQDWTAVVVHGIKKRPADRARAPHILVPKRSANAGLERKIEEGRVKTERVPKDVRTDLVKRRVLGGLTQATLAQAMNVPTKSITNVENGKATYNKAFISRIRQTIARKQKAMKK